MGRKVGSKGQVVIYKEYRDKLGVKPGWTALQLLVDDHVEIYFLPPPSNESLAGSLAKYANPVFEDTDENWHKIKDFAWKAAVEEKMSPERYEE
ncbi:MAG: AbrB/MazE/SpoVT family DNA-binding domain-containing protein [Chloroflexi bacterium]|nr:AbrB/MazE/SpoVT family DNA-binding domain-containing protein [Chloroflexota bacterium]